MMPACLPRRALVATGARLAWGMALGAMPGTPKAADRLRLQVSAYPLPFLPVQVDGEAVLALLDSGSASSLRISRRLASRLTLTPVPMPDATVRGLDGQAVALARLTVAELKLDGQRTLGPIEAEVAGTRIEAISAQVGTSFDAVLGWGLLRRQPFLLDLASQQLWLGPDARLPGPARFECPLAEVGGLPVVEARFDGRPLRLLVDTGAPMCNIDQGFAQVSAGEVVERDLALGSWTQSLTWRSKDLAVQRRALATEGTLGLNLLQRVAWRSDPERRWLAFG